MTCSPRCQHDAGQPESNLQAPRACTLIFPSVFALTFTLAFGCGFNEPMVARHVGAVEERQKCKRPKLQTGHQDVAKSLQHQHVASRLGRLAAWREHRQQSAWGEPPSAGSTRVPQTLQGDPRLRVGLILLPTGERLVVQMLHELANAELVDARVARFGFLRERIGKGLG